jgi:hypothetical protein
VGVKWIERYKREPALWTGLLTAATILAVDYAESGQVQPTKVLRAAVPLIGGVLIRLHVSPRHREGERRGSGAGSRFLAS